MSDSTAKYDFDPRSTEQFVEEFVEKLAGVERSISLLREFLVQKARVAPLPCHICPKQKCRKPCEALEAYLARPYGGRIHGEGTIDLSLDNVSDGTGFCDDLEEENRGRFDHSKLRDIQKVSSLGVFEEYEKCWHIFTNKQREVLPLRHHDGKTLAQIAKELGKEPSTVWGLLNRAEKRKEKYYQGKK